MHLNGCLADSVSTPTWIYGIPSSSTGSLIVLTGSSRLGPSTPQIQTSPPGYSSLAHPLATAIFFAVPKERAFAVTFFLPETRTTGRAGTSGEESFCHSACARFFRTRDSFVELLDIPREGNLIDILPPTRFLSYYLFLENNLYELVKRSIYNFLKHF